MRSKIGQRPLTEDERRAIHRWLPPLARNLPGSLLRYLLLVLVVFLALVVASLGIDAVIRRMWHASMPLWVVVTFGIGFYATTFLAPLPFVLRSHRRRMARDGALHHDHRDGVAQIVDMQDVSAVLAWLAHHPILCFELCDGQRLFLHGERLRWDSVLFGPPHAAAARDVACREDASQDAREDEAAREDERDDERDDDDWIGRFPFPNRHCVIHRLPHSGRILRIELLGDAVQPTLSDSPDSTLLEAASRFRRHLELESLLVDGNDSAARPPSHACP